MLNSLFASLLQCLSETNVANVAYVAVAVAAAVAVDAHVVQTFPLHCMIAILRKTILFVLFRFVLVAGKCFTREKLIVAKVAQLGVFDYPNERETAQRKVARKKASQRESTSPCAKIA